MNNPYKPGSFAHQEFNTHVSWYKSHSIKYLVDKAHSLRQESKDFCRYSWKQMSDMDTQAKHIEMIIRSRISETAH